MQYVMIGLLIFSAILLVASLFTKDPCHALREEIDQVSMQHIQELYNINKKLKVLEEELLVNESVMPSIPIKPTPVVPEKREVHAILKNQVVSLFQQGLTMDQISKQSSLSVEDVDSILKEYVIRGNFQ